MFGVWGEIVDRGKCAGLPSPMEKEAEQVRQEGGGRLNRQNLSKADLQTGVQPLNRRKERNHWALLVSVAFQSLAHQP